jgi:Kef-type K+ transport system membrane component KefB
MAFSRQVCRWLCRSLAREQESSHRRGLIPRGEVGLIRAQMGLASGVFDVKLFSAVTLMVMVTTLLAPPLPRALFPSEDPSWIPPPADGIEEL